MRNEMNTREKVKCFLQKNLLTILFMALVGIISVATCIKLLQTYATGQAINNQATATTNAFEADLSASVLGKDFFLNLNGMMHVLFGERRMNDVVKLNNGYLVMPSAKAKQEDMDFAADSLQDLQQTLRDKGIQMLYVMTPSKISPADPELPEGETDFSNEEMDYFFAALDERQVSAIDLRPAFINYPAGYYALEYRTDHHWNMQGGFLAYTQIVQQLVPMLGMQVPNQLTDLQNYTVTSYKGVEFGNYAQRTGRGFCREEDFDLIEPAFPTCIENVESGEVGTYAEILTRKDMLETAPDEVKKRAAYDYVLEKSIGTFHNEEAPCNKKILVIGDSMTKGVAPFLELMFQDVKCLNAYDVTNLFTQKLLDDYQPDAVLFIHHCARVYNPEMFVFDLNG